MSCLEGFLDWISDRSSPSTTYQRVSSLGPSVPTGGRRGRQKHEAKKKQDVDADEDEAASEPLEKKRKHQDGEDADQKLQERLLRVRATLERQHRALIPDRAWIDETWISIAQYLASDYEPQGGQILCFPAVFDVEALVLLYAYALTLWDEDVRILMLSSQVSARRLASPSITHISVHKSARYEDDVNRWWRETEGVKRVWMIPCFEAEFADTYLGLIRAVGKPVVGFNDPRAYVWSTLKKLLSKAFQVPLVDRDLFDSKRSVIPAPLTFGSSTLLNRHLKRPNVIAFQPLHLSRPSEMQPLHYYWIEKAQIKRSDVQDCLDRPLLVAFQKRHPILYLVDRATKQNMKDKALFHHQNAQVITFDSIPAGFHWNQAILTWGFDVVDLLTVLVRFPSPILFVAWTPDPRVLTRAVKQYDMATRVAAASMPWKNQAFAELPLEPLVPTRISMEEDDDAEEQEEKVELTPSPESIEEPQMDRAGGGIPEGGSMMTVTIPARSNYRAAAPPHPPTYNDDPTV